MKKFKFSLQTVHELRESKRDQELSKLAELQNALAQITEELEQAERERHEATENYANKIQAGELLSFEIALMLDYLRSLATREQAARARLEQARQACLSQSRNVAEASREVKVTSALRERHHARHLLEMNRAEQTALDEMVSINFARQMTAK